MLTSNPLLQLAFTFQDFTSANGEEKSQNSLHIQKWKRDQIKNGKSVCGKEEEKNGLLKRGKYISNML